MLFRSILNDTAGITNSSGVITLDYAGDPNGSLVTGSTDVVLINSSLSLSFPGNVVWSARVTNSAGPDYPDKATTQEKKARKKKRAAPTGAEVVDVAEAVVATVTKKLTRNRKNKQPSSQQWQPKKRLQQQNL